MTPLKVKLFLALLACSSLLAPSLAAAMGIRSFVALPVNKGGLVLRQQYLNSPKFNTSRAIFSGAWGLSGRDTLLFGLPYRLTPAGHHRTGDLGFLYRRTFWQVDSSHATSRIALLAGGVLTTDSHRDNAVQLGMVATFYRDRNSYDLDAVYRRGLGSRGDEGQYDISWQYRLSPAEYPEWGFTPEWFTVLELNGRWRQGRSIDHQFTLGLQWVHHNWVLEGGIIRTINNAKQTEYLVSTRFHF